MEREEREDGRVETRTKSVGEMRHRFLTRAQ